MLKFENGIIVDLTEEEESSVKAAVEAYKKRELKRPLEPHEVFNLLAKSLVNTVSIDDQTSLRMKGYYPTFEEIAALKTEEERKIPAGFKLFYKGDLWKAVKEHVVQEIYPPSINTASLYERIDEEHTGTVDDPIPYDQNMKVYKNLFYTHNGVLYLCIRDSGQPLFADPDSLIGNYFEKV